MDHLDIPWLLLLAGAFTGFATLETVALVSRRTDRTLSARIRAWLGIDPPKPWRHTAAVVFTAAVTAFAAWLVPHITG